MPEQRRPREMSRRHEQAGDSPCYSPCEVDAQVQRCRGLPRQIHHCCQEAKDGTELAREVKQG
jgi:hypothetical protein